MTLLRNLQGLLCLLLTLQLPTNANGLQRPGSDSLVRHMGANPAFSPRGGSTKEASVAKQGAYGKIQTHKESFLFQLLLHPDEAVYLFMILFASKKANSSSGMKIAKSLPEVVQYDLTWCNNMLAKVSRSFTVVIQQLPEKLRVDVMIFYLVLRALDTIEDDTWSFENNRDKITLLKQFHQQALQTSKPWSLDNVGEGDEKILLQNFPKVQNVYKSMVSAESQAIIADITKRMAAGMAETVGKDLTQGTVDVEEYNKYCHYVAGLVGFGLSGLFSQSGLEQSYLAKEYDLSNQMGLFLQKTNILRDYLEDYVEGRTFWPQSIWKKHSNGSQDLGYFTNQTSTEVQENSLRCLNEMVTEALELVPACLAYLGALQTKSIFCFCAIPQVMAMATLAKCYANRDVFTGVVKLRRSLSCKLMVRASSSDGVHVIFYQLAKSIEGKARKLERSGLQDPSRAALFDACEVIRVITGPAYRRQQRAKLLPIAMLAVVVACQKVPELSFAVLALVLLNLFFGPAGFLTT